MFDTAIAGSLPKPTWLAETGKLWPRWQAAGPELARAKLDATLLWIKAQEDAGLSVIGDGEQSRQHFVHGFLACVEGIDFEPAWGVAALERAAQGHTCTTAVHVCCDCGIQANIDWKNTLGQEWRQYENVFPALAARSIAQVSLACIHSHVPPDLMALLQGKDVMVGVIDVASDVVETLEEEADTVGRALQFVPWQHLIACTHCGLARAGMRRAAVTATAP